MSEPLSVVIAALNAETTIGQQLLALTNQPWPSGGEIIVADNGSTDATPEIVNAHVFDHCPAGAVTIRLVNCGETAGAGHARNSGVAASTFDQVAFCDADDIVADNWVAAMSRALDDHEAVGGRLDLNQLNPDWVVGSRGNALAANELPTFDGVFPVLSSCNLGIRRRLFEELGGFDESYLGNEDAELSLRLFERGADTYFAHDAVVNYRLRSTLSEVFSQARNWGEGNVRLRRRLPKKRRLRSTVRSWLWLVTHVHHLARPSERARWVYIAGLRSGLALGSVRQARQFFT